MWIKFINVFCGGGEVGYTIGWQLSINCLSAGLDLLEWVFYKPGRAPLHDNRSGRFHQESPFSEKVTFIESAVFFEDGINRVRYPHTTDDTPYQSGRRQGVKGEAWPGRGYRGYTFADAATVFAPQTAYLPFWAFNKLLNRL